MSRADFPRCCGAAEQLSSTLDQALCAHLFLKILGRMVEEDLVLLSQSEESSGQKTRRNSIKKIERALEADIRCNVLYWKQLAYYTISHMFTGIIGIIIRYSIPKTLLAREKSAPQKPSRTK